MKQVCIKNCQIKLAGGVTYVSKNSVIEYPAEHKCLVPIEEIILDFLNDSEESLMATKWSFEQADKAMQETFGKSLKREEGTKKSEIVAQIMDIRYRALDINPNDVVK